MMTATIAPTVMANRTMTATMPTPDISRQNVQIADYVPGSESTTHMQLSKYAQKHRPDIEIIFNIYGTPTHTFRLYPLPLTLTFLLPFCSLFLSYFKSYYILFPFFTFFL